MKTSELRLTDFDDLRRYEGLAAVKEQILNPAPLQQTAKGEVNPPGPTASEQKGPPSTSDKPSAGLAEARLVKLLLDKYSDHHGATLIRQGKDFFHWVGTHWTHLDPLIAPDLFRRELDNLAGGKLKYKDIASAYSRFFTHLEMVPPNVNMFAPNPFAQNFANGTVQLNPRLDGTFEISLHPHKREDYLIHCHPFDYLENAAKNDEFEATLDRIWKDDPDIEQKKTSYFEVLGACLIPAFRKLVLFVGPPKSGKSTLVLFAANMVHPDYRCSVDPTQFNGFNLESMAGKLLNFDTDINLVNPITDSILKKVEDRCPMRIRRKGIADIYAPIPGMHLFAANKMPISTEGAQAYDRRMLVFKCDKYQPPAGAYIQDFAQHVWAKGCQGIVARAIEGLKRLAGNGGHFTVPDSSMREIEKWKKTQGDVVQDFLHEIEETGIKEQSTQVLMGKTHQIERGNLWDVFKAWADKNSPHTRLPGKIRFYARLEELGIGTKTVKGVWFFSGIGVAQGEESEV